ncbi:zinc finger, CCHC-type containing protein [Tanacetum coccineum]
MVDAEAVGCCKVYNRPCWLMLRMPYKLLQADVKVATKPYGLCGGCHIDSRLLQRLPHRLKADMKAAIEVVGFNKGCHIAEKATTNLKRLYRGYGLDILLKTNPNRGSYNGYQTFLFKTVMEIMPIDQGLLWGLRGEGQGSSRRRPGDSTGPSMGSSTGPSRRRPGGFNEKARGLLRTQQRLDSSDGNARKRSEGYVISSIMENNIWVLSDLPPGFRQKEGIDYFDTYAPVARITTIRFKFDGSGKGVIHCLYVDGMLLFGTDQNQVDKTKKFLPSKFSMKDMGEAGIILDIKIKRENKRIIVTQSRYIEKILKKFNREYCSPVSTPMDPVEKLIPNTCKPMDQLEYLRAISYLMYVMTSTRPNIAYAVGRLSRFTSIPSRQHSHAITRVFKYLKGTMNYGYP